MSSATMELGNSTARMQGGVQAGGIRALDNFGDIASLRDVRATAHSGALADLVALGSNAGYGLMCLWPCLPQLRSSAPPIFAVPHWLQLNGVAVRVFDDPVLLFSLCCMLCRAGQNMSSVEAAALPAVLRGLSVDVTSMNKVGCASLVAISAAALADTSQTAPQVFILASNENALKPIRSRMSEISKETKLTTFDALSGHVCVGTATEALKSGGMKGAKFVAIADADELSSGQGDTADRVSHLIDTAGSKRPQVLLVGTERAEKRNPKVKGLQDKIVGAGGHIQLTDGKDLFDFMAKAKLAVSAVVLSSLGTCMLVCVRREPLSSAHVAC
jgi:hypothetical protein